MVTAEGFRPPRRLLLTSLLASPALCGWMLGAGAVHVMLAATPLGGWPCPVLTATGQPCPGCGLGRACVLLLHGEVGESMRLHAFAGILLAALAILAAGALPWSGSAQVRAVVQRVEERTWLVPTLFVALLLYWLARFALDAAAYLALVV